MNTTINIVITMFLLFIAIIMTGQLTDKLAITVLSTIWLITGYFLGKCEEE